RPPHPRAVGPVVQLVGARAGVQVHRRRRPAARLGRAGPRLLDVSAVLRPVFPHGRRAADCMARHGTEAREALSEAAALAVQSSGGSPLGAIFTRRGSKRASGSTRSCWAAITSSMSL